VCARARIGARVFEVVENSSICIFFADRIVAYYCASTSSELDWPLTTVVEQVVLHDPAAARTVGHEAILTVSERVFPYGEVVATAKLKDVLVVVRAGILNM
jgi:hypothetical protein